MRQFFSRRRLLGGFLAGLCGTWLGRDRSAPAASPGPAPAPPSALPPRDFRGDATPWTSYAGSPSPEADIPVRYAYDAQGRLIQEGPGASNRP
jgi:hypothetical protein